MSAEEEPYLPLQWGEKEIRMTAYNSMLYTFIGRALIDRGGDKYEIDCSALNHVWVSTRENRGMYFWEEYDPEEYRTMAAFIIENEFPALFNSRYLASDDVEIWVEEFEKNIDDFSASIPDAPDV